MSGARPSWSATARWQGAGPLALACRREPLLALLGRGESLTPVEYLLLGAAGCYALSLEGARRTLKLADAAFEVVATGTKADGEPSRLEALRLEVRIDGAISPDAIAELAAVAKRMCTVTNTLDGAPDVFVALNPSGHAAAG